MTDAPDFLRASDIASQTGVSLRTVRRWIAEKTLPSVKLRGVRLVPRKALEQVLLPAPGDWADSGEETPQKYAKGDYRESTKIENVPSVV